MLSRPLARRSHGGLFHELHDAERRENAHRHVEQKHPAPREVVRNPAAQRRPQHGRDDDGHRRDRERPPAFFGGKRVENDGLLVRLQPAAEEALQDAKDDQLTQVRRDAAQERAHREGRNADQEVALSAEQPRKERRNGQHDAVGDEVRGERPRGLVVARRHRARNVRQRDVHDGRVQHLHERRKRDDDGDHPRVRSGSPCVVALVLSRVVLVTHPL